MFYLHFEPENCFAAAGIWRPNNRALTGVRSSIVKEPGRWAAIRKKVELEGDSLSRPPRDFDPKHPFVDDLKRKSFMTSVVYGQSTINVGNPPRDLNDVGATPLQILDSCSLCRLVNIGFTQPGCTHAHIIFLIAAVFAKLEKATPGFVPAPRVQPGRSAYAEMRSAEVGDFLVVAGDR